ncbi:MAG: S8 family serine peptidase, partial [Trueperaceae bacterium]|nr:S8 family serine peptidase [Trueperaceae bacterium]
MRSDLVRGLVAVLSLSLLALLVACFQQVAPVLTVSPTAHTVVEGGVPQAFTATLENASDTIDWSLEPDVGSITPTTGPTTTYTPPASVTEATQVTLTATAGSLTASAVITVAPTPPANELLGELDDPVEGAIPSAEFVPREEDYAEDHPDLPGVPISFNTLVLVFEMGTTVGEANDLLSDIGAEIVGGIPGVVGEAEGILFLRVPTADHQAMIDLLERLRADELVKHVVQDGLLTPTRVSRPNTGTPAGWTWQTAPAGGNWGLERIRVPQLWNLNAAVAKRGNTTPTGVLDVGFANSHQDLVYDQNLTSGTQHEHGTHVAGTIAATFDNGVGVDGVNPFAELVLNAPAFSGSGSTLSVRTSWGQQMSAGFFGLINARTDVLVVNASLGYNWGPAGINQNTNTAVHDLVENQGAIFVLAELIHLIRGRRLPLFVVAAGNDSNDISDGAGGFVRMQARWGSPFAYAGIEFGMSNIIVVESVANSAASAGGATRSGFSNIGGDISAPGSDVLSTSWRSGTPTTFYETMSGTSMAAPHVTGLISYLYAVDPTLTHSQIVGLLAANAVAVAGGASPRIDAFATVIDIDRVKGGDAVLRMLLDIDDGTPDGNQRVLVGTAVDFVGEDADGDGGIGDGNIDMSDFRRWRDWLLQVENPAGLTLDGSANHPKKDVNGDRAVGTPAQENVFPRGDFNGDGQLSRTATRFVPGRVNATVTDLGVLQTLFSDPNYSASQLPGLIDSGDLEIWPSDCLARPGVVSVTSSIRVTGTTTPIQSRTHT